MPPLFKTAVKILAKSLENEPNGVENYYASKEDDNVKITKGSRLIAKVPFEEFAQITNRIDGLLQERSTYARMFAIHFHLVAKGYIS